MLDPTIPEIRETASLRFQLSEKDKPSHENLEEAFESIDHFFYLQNFFSFQAKSYLFSRRNFQEDDPSNQRNQSETQNPMKELDELDQDLLEESLEPEPKKRLKFT